MEIIGIICEYNPFHNGHIHHINEIKKRYPNSLIILVLNGYFLERGEISILTKYDKCALALNHNVDIVIELPILYGTQSADTFAYYAIWYLNKLKVSHIIFGSESNDITTIQKIANESLENNYSQKIKDNLKQGMNYPTALAKSLDTPFTFLANDLLGISYLKAIKQINPCIIPETIQRTNDYLDLDSNANIISAANIRNKLKNKQSIDNYLPESSCKLIKDIDNNLYFTLLKTLIINNDHLADILDVDEGIENRLIKAISECHNLSELIEFVKTKRYTYNKINRMLIHILLNIKKDDAKLIPDYLKILGFNQKGKEYLQRIKKDIDISLNCNKNSKIYSYELKAAIIYDLLTKGNEEKKELANKPIIC